MDIYYTPRLRLSIPREQGMMSGLARGRRSPYNVYLMARRRVSENGPCHHRGLKEGLMKKLTTLRIAAAAVVVFAALSSARAARRSGPSTTAGPTPPMGWNSWNKFACNVSERPDQEPPTPWSQRHEGRRLSVRRDRRLLAGGARRQGQHRRRPPSAFPPASRRWPITSIRKGLKFGIYSDAGTETCPDRPGAAAMSSRTRGSTPRGASIT